MKKISFLFIAGCCLLFAQEVSANCMWTLNNACRDIGVTNNWSGAGDNACKSTQKPNGSTAKCCCAADIKGCCEKKDANNNITTLNTTGEECKKITYAQTTFYQDKEAMNNICSNKTSTGCQWQTVTDSQQPGVPAATCGGNATKKDDFSCTTEKPTDRLGSHSICCCSTQIANGSTNDTTREKPKFIMPELQITIPGLTLTPSSSVEYIDNGDGSYQANIPWLAEYIQGIYKYGLEIAGILAAIILMAGGVLWLISGGDASKVTQSKELITGSIIGLIILFSSSILWYGVNPALTNLKMISVGTVSKVDLYSLPMEEQGDAPTSNGNSHGVPWYFQCSQEGKSTLYNYDGNNKMVCQPTAAENSKYGANRAPNVCTSGCGVVSSLMVLGKFGINLSIADWTKEVMSNNGRTCNAGSNVAGLQKALANHGLKSVTLQKSQISKALDDGHPIVMSVKGPCEYTQHGHYIVLTGWRDKSHNLADVNDPANGRQETERKCIDVETLKACGSTKPQCGFTSAFYVYK